MYILYLSWDFVEVWTPNSAKEGVVIKEIIIIKKKPGTLHSISQISKTPPNQRYKCVKSFIRLSPKKRASVRHPDLTWPPGKLFTENLFHKFRHMGTQKLLQLRS
jgi:hypothetical protein